MDILGVRNETRCTLLTSTSFEVSAQLVLESYTVPIHPVILTIIGTNVNAIFKRGGFVFGDTGVVVRTTETNVLKIIFRVRSLDAMFYCFGRNFGTKILKIGFQENGFWSRFFFKNRHFLI